MIKLLFLAPLFILFSCGMEEEPTDIEQQLKGLTTTTINGLRPGSQEYDYAFEACLALQEKVIKFPLFFKNKIFKYDTSYVNRCSNPDASLSQSPGHLKLDDGLEFIPVPPQEPEDFPTGYAFEDFVTAQSDFIQPFCAFILSPDREELAREGVPNVLRETPETLWTVRFYRGDELCSSDPYHTCMRVYKGIKLSRTDRDFRNAVIENFVIETRPASLESQKRGLILVRSEYQICSDPGLDPAVHYQLQSAAFDRIFVVD